MMDATEIARQREKTDDFVAEFERTHNLCGYSQYRLDTREVLNLLSERRALLAALEQAQKETDEAITHVWTGITQQNAAERDAAQQRDAIEAWRQFHVENAKDGELWKDRALLAQKDAKDALALLKQALMILPHNGDGSIYARIEAMLEKKI